MHDFSQWLQSADAMDMTPLFIIGIIACLMVGVATESSSSLLLAVLSAIGMLVIPSPHDLRTEITQVWGLESVSSECNLPDHELPTGNTRCYVTDKTGHKTLVEIRVSKDGTKLGLYDTDGKALKTTGKE
ncbi:hypothetical protein BBK15_09970 [Bifidobacterium adolescentis]|uniref:Uncharacterized protein n=1 Tax=Bifidobacterium adolescentis TaxID=1680 RepID=A0A1E7XXV5_BIFAD|nr:hypothetical protein [Bifidobacterium adolescentis]OFA33628.1 hypothetical protein BBK15_09970 [Bifidobacterium adolescentis]